MEFTLTMEDLAIGTKSAKQMIQGGTMIVNTLKAVIETGRPSLGTRGFVRSLPGDAAVHAEKESDGTLAGRRTPSIERSGTVTG